MKLGFVATEPRKGSRLGAACGSLAIVSALVGAPLGCAGDPPAVVPTATASASTEAAAPRVPGQDLDETQAALLSRGRYAVRLNDGRVLAAGGEDGVAATDRVEIFDPKTNRWSPAEPMKTKRQFHALVVLGDGRVLALGGDDAQRPVGADPGVGKTLASCEAFDPKTGHWKAAPSMRAPRKRFTATRLNDGRVLVVGAPESELFDPAHDAFIPASPIQTTVPYSGHTATLLADGKVLVVGGGGQPFRGSADTFDPDTNSWTVATAPTQTLSEHTATLLNDGTVLIVGGLVTPNGQFPYPIAYAAVFEPKLGRWNITGQPRGPHWHHSAALLANGDVLVTGGMKGEPELYSREIFRPLPPALQSKLDAK